MRSKKYEMTGKLILLTLFMSFAFNSYTQIQKERWFIHPEGPGTSSLCASLFIFYDSIGFYYSGCENHTRGISAFKYQIDSNSLECSFIPYPLFKPYVKIIKKKVDSLGNRIHVKVYEYSGRSVWPEIAVVKLNRKKDRIIKSHYNFNDTLSFERINRKKIFWTLEGLYPIFFAEMHFSFESPENYYEIYLNLPHECFTITEGKRWAEGIIKFKILSPKSIYSNVEYKTD
jgi:hypothetical protein